MSEVTIRYDQDRKALVLALGDQTREVPFPVTERVVVRFDVQVEVSVEPTRVAA